MSVSIESRLRPSSA